MRKIFFLIFTLTICGYAQATIRIVSTTPASTTCNGSILVEASGNAGPFRVQVMSANGSVLADRTMLNPTENISGLCSGQYTVQVYNALGCARTLLTEVFVVPQFFSSKPNKFQTGLDAGNWTAVAYPNPFAQDFQLSLNWGKAQSEHLEIEVHNALGQLIYSQIQEAIPGQNLYNIKLGDSSARGILHLVLRDKQGRQQVLKIMQVKE